jgi:hypothetical protein
MRHVGASLRRPLIQTAHPGFGFNIYFPNGTWADRPAFKQFIRNCSTSAARTWRRVPILTGDFNGPQPIDLRARQNEKIWFHARARLVQDF